MGKIADFFLIRIRIICIQIYFFILTFTSSIYKVMFSQVNVKISFSIEWWLGTQDTHLLYCMSKSPGYNNIWSAWSGLLNPVRPCNKNKNKVHIQKPAEISVFWTCGRPPYEILYLVFATYFCRRAPRIRCIRALESRAKRIKTREKHFSRQNTLVAIFCSFLRRRRKAVAFFELWWVHDRQHI